MNKLDKQYQDLLQDILDNGVKKQDRTGTGTISVFGRQIRHNMKDGFPLLTTKKMAIKSIMTELKWFLKGDTNIKYLVDNGCNIWNGDCFANYKINNPKPKTGDWENYIDCYCGHTDACDCGPLSEKEFIEQIKTDDEFANEWGELGPIYGKQWRDWQSETLIPTNLKMDGNVHYVTGTKRIDQIANLINDLKTNPDSRRLMVSAWNVGELDQMVLPPCHYGFQVYTRELSLDERNNSLGPGKAYLGLFGINEKNDLEYKELFDKENRPTRAISLMWNQRSCDVPLGLPFNIASYATLLELLAKECNMVADELIGNLGDCHIYRNQIEGSTNQISRESKPYLPKLKLGKVDILNGEFDYEVLNYKSHPAIKFPLSN